jgi:predicted AlkP superfamily pyrophosphatase or phosphodiesterase
MGGHSPSAAYWYDPGSGRFVTSTYYMPTLPSWVAKFNRNSPVKDYCGRKWIALPDTPGGSGKFFNEFHGGPNESCPDPKFLGWLQATPFMSEIELAFAQEAIKNEHLGQGSDTDLLAISLSVNDYIGHAFGPYSPQVADVTLRTDHYLASFFADLDKLVGLKNTWIALAADHGVAPNPEFIQGHKWGRGNAQPALIRNAVEKGMASVFGPGAWVAGADEPYIYLDYDALEMHHIQARQAEEVAATAAASAPGVMAAFTRTQLLTGSLPSSPLARAASNSFNPKRGGDVFIVLDPYAVPVSGTKETSHGSPWSYDSQVPLLLWGSAFRPGVYFSQCQPTDLAATLAATLGLAQPSGSQGSPLVPAIR